MVTVITGHTQIYNLGNLAADIIKEYQENNFAVINLNGEGPCCDSIELYKILDYICQEFKFKKSNISIMTCNSEEAHPEYNIVHKTQHWIHGTYKGIISKGYKKEVFYKTKQFNNLFGCLYNVPSWDRLCLLSHIDKNVHPSLLACNGVWKDREYNSYYLNDVTDYAPTEIFNIVDFLKQGIGPLPGHPGHKIITYDGMADILPFYNNFFIDMVAETYIHGLTFFITEKTIRPIYAMTPFIINGSQGFLSSLKTNYGFKSFDRYWDESYDNYQNYERIQKIYKVIDYIDTKSTVELQDMYNDMTEILEFNHDRLCEINNDKK